MDEKAEDFKRFLRWTIDRYPRVGTGSSLGNYWRVLKMHFLELKGRYMDENVARDVINVRTGLRSTRKVERSMRLYLVTTHSTRKS